MTELENLQTEGKSKSDRYTSDAVLARANAASTRTRQNAFTTQDISELHRMKHNGIKMSQNYKYMLTHQDVTHIHTHTANSVN